MLSNGKKIFCLGLIIILMAGAAFAVPPHPDLLKKIHSGEIQTPSYLTLENRQEYGLDAPGSSELLKSILTDEIKTAHSKALATGNFNVLALLVNFTDKPNSVGAVKFDSLLFSASGNTVRDYYSEISYNQLDLVTVNLPSSSGWYTAPQTSNYYANNEFGTGYSSYPNNAQKLVEDLVAMADGSVDFSNYDNDNNGYVDVLVVIHSGRGGEVTSDSTDIWSHKWNTRTPRATGDGVYVYEYTIQPEYISSPGDMTIGVFCHELGHAFGLPDLYDIDYSSNGIGKWGIMAYGSWGGVNGNLPSHPCAWSRIQMGFATATIISSNVSGQSIPDVKTNGDIFRLWTSGSVGDEYFLIENRQKTGYDASLPGSGLLIWHIDDAMATIDNTDNASHWYPGMDSTQHYRVALEQADGLFELEHANDVGDANDVFITGRKFDATGSANSNSYLNGVSFVAVDNVSLAASTMTADFTVALAAGIEDDNIDNTILPNRVELNQNYPNPFNPTTEISFYADQPGQAELSVFNLSGQKVKTIFQGEVSAGSNSFTWHGDNDQGSKVASGIYLYRLDMNGQQSIRKMALIK